MLVPSPPRGNIICIFMRNDHTIINVLRHVVHIEQEEAELIDRDFKTDTHQKPTFLFISTVWYQNMVEAPFSGEISQQLPAKLNVCISVLALILRGRKLVKLTACLSFQLSHSYIIACETC